MGILRMLSLVLVMRRVHPIWYLVGFSLFIGVANKVLESPQGAAPAAPASSGDYATEVAKMITTVADVDSHGDESMKPYYEETILGLDAYCSENVGLVVRLAAEEVDRQGNIDEQFALLNELEETLALAEDAPVRPTPCEPLIGQ